MPNFCSNQKRTIWIFVPRKKKSENFCPRVYLGCSRVCRHWCDSSIITINNHRNLPISLQRCYNESNGVWNHRRLDCLLKRLFRHKSKKASKLCVTGLCEGNSPMTGESPHKGPDALQMFPFDDVIVWSWVSLNNTVWTVPLFTELGLTCRPMTHIL